MNIQLDPKNDQIKVAETILILSLASMIIGFIFEIEQCFAISTILLLAYLIAYRICLWITRIWLGFSKVLGGLMSRLLLSLCFYLVLTPISFIYRLFNTDNLDLKPTKTSYFHTRDVIFDKQYFERIW